MASYPFAQFTRDVDSLVRSEKVPKILLQLVHSLMKALLAQRNWLDQKYCRPAPGKAYSQYLRYPPPDEARCAVAFVCPGEPVPRCMTMAPGV